ncbi:DUF2628 domain-containing protein [Bacillus sp. FSL K6-3431]|uniref:DUF2628 domain-containing protein n=1 Tax=Bacillus sp. FSL K6-3431 TaxID=2921500 RepID=UPI0030F753A3
MKHCHRCGNNLDENKDFCSKCGDQFNDDGSTINIDINELAQNDATVLPKFDSELDLSIFVGKKYPYYNRKWIKNKENKPTWNFAAFFLSLFWLGYRKMYIPIVIIIATFFFIDFLLYISDYKYSTVDNSISFAIAILLGLYGNHFYLLNAKKKVSAIREKGLSSEDKNVELHKKGGTSWLGVFIALVSLLLYAFASSALFPTAEDKVSGLKDGTFYDSAAQTVGETMDNFFLHPEWKVIKNDAGEEIIRFTGKKENSTIKIDFISDGELFDVHNAEIDGEQLDEDEMNEVLNLIITEN